MLVSLTVGKVDAGVTVLLTQDKRLIEFPSILLPPNIASGSIVDIAVSRNQGAEAAAEAAFAALQTRIRDTFGTGRPAAPVLRCRNATQTSVVLEWEAVQLATADLISLVLYRNGQKAGPIPRPLQMRSTKISGLAVDTEYEFHLVLRTSAGTLDSERVRVRTHKMTDLSGVTITTGILPGATRDRLAAAVARIGAKLVPEPGVVRIDTTHFVTTEGRGLAWEKAVELNIPVVRPEWVAACESSGRILGVTKFYLDAVRPGPDETASPDKALPPQPADPGDEDDNNHKGHADNTADNTAEDTTKDKTVVPGGDDQKVFLGDDEHGPQKLAQRPRPATVEDDDDGDDDDKESEREDEDGKKGKNARLSPGAAKSPGGDGSSFQDVAL